jgi:cytochrome c oxidase subunit 1
MSSVLNLQEKGLHAAHDAHHEHHHHETFISKYIFSQDHKTIAKQFLVTGYGLLLEVFFL